MKPGPPCDITISLGELFKVRRQMTSGQWKWHSENPRSVEIYGSNEARFDDKRDAAGVAAEHNAIPVLMEIAAAALAYQQSECTGQLCSHPAHRTPCAILSTQNLLETALTKVRP